MPRKLVHTARRRAQGVWTAGGPGWSALTRLGVHGNHAACAVPQPAQHIMEGGPGPQAPPGFRTSGLRSGYKSIPGP